jgi:hypothetical protein
MGNSANRFLEPDPSSRPSQPSTVVSSETETAVSSRYILPKDLDAALTRLDDQQLDRLASAVLEERTRRRKPFVPKGGQRQRHDEKADAVSLPQGKLNAVKAAFKVGVTPARIAREFGLSLSDVRKVLSGHADRL